MDLILSVPVLYFTHFLNIRKQRLTCCRVKLASVISALQKISVDFMVKQIKTICYVAF